MPIAGSKSMDFKDALSKAISNYNDLQHDSRVLNGYPESQVMAAAKWRSKINLLEGPWRKVNQTL